MIGINVPVHASVDVAHRHGTRGKKGTAASGELGADGLSASDQDITLRQVQDKLQIISAQAGTSAAYVGVTSFAVIDAHGGHAGSGGKAGDGGSVTLTVSEADLALLVLAEPDTAHGKAAAGSNSAVGSSAPASGGRDARVAYRIVNATGDELASASDRFNACIVSYDVCDENEDGIFERGEHFTVRNVKIVNTGGLPLPAGATLSFLDLPYPHAPTVKWIDAGLTLSLRSALENPFCSPLPIACFDSSFHSIFPLAHPHPRRRESSFSVDQPFLRASCL